MPLSGAVANEERNGHKVATRRERRKAQKTQELVNQTLARLLGKYPPLTSLHNLQGNLAFLKFIYGILKSLGNIFIVKQI